MDGFAFPNGVASFESSRQVRFMTAGSVDDGKSTLIGRLLLDAGVLMRDQAVGLDDDEADLAALTDGLESERAQGITIDVAYRYFSTPESSFIIADAPGHEQYTRNMVTAASVSDVAVIVIDAAGVTNGELKRQTRRHAAIAALMGLDVVVAVNKMDAVGWSQERFDEVRGAFADLAGTLELRDVRYVPVSAKSGDNVVRAGGATWWTGLSLLEVIEKSRAMASSSFGPLRLPIQTMLRDAQRRYYAGRVESGLLRPGDKVVVGARSHPATIAQVRVGGRGVASAEAGVSVAVELAEDRDVARGDVIAAPDVSYVRSVVADLCWLDEAPWRKGRRYVLRQGTLETPALIEGVNFVRVIEDLSEREADGLALNDIGNVRVTTQDPILGDLYVDAPAASAFVLFDPQTHQTCAVGMIRELDMTGTVYLVGAGPGAADLLTVRAANLIQRADVVLHDALVSADVLALAKGAQALQRGQARGSAVCRPALHLQIASAFGVAARHGRAAKGGDPNLFGRATEEMNACAEAGVPVVVVPGISAGFAAASSLGVSLTARGVSRSVTFVTPTVASGGGETEHWADAAAAAETAVVYMGAQQAKRVAQALMTRGVPALRPVAFVESASSAGEKIVRGVLRDLPALAAELGDGPAIMIIGDAVADVRAALRDVEAA